MLLGVVLAAGCSGAPEVQTPELGRAPAVAGHPVELDNCGRSVIVPAPPQRAVTINQPASELLLALGLADRMAGTASWSDPVHPDLAEANAGVPRISTHFPSFDRLLAEKPDFVYASFDYSFTHEGVAPRDRFERFGVPTYQSTSECGGQEAQQQRPRTINDLYTEIRDIARIFGISERGEELVASLDERMVTAGAGLDAADLSMMWWYAATRTPYVAGCCGAPGLVTRELGAVNSFADNRQLWPEVSWEAVLDRNPDVLILADLTRGDDGDSARAKIDFLESNPVTQRLTAVQERRWIVVPGSAMDPSLRNVDAVEAVAQGLRDLGMARR